LGQLPLQLTLADHASFETFVSGGNATAVEHVRSLAQGTADTVWLWGPASAGKSHLLQAACRSATAAGRRAMYVSLPAESPAVLVDLEQVELLAIDDLHCVAGDLDWERPLFAILNANLARHGSLLLAARAPARQCGFRLPDLASRGAGAVTFRLGQLNDAKRASRDMAALTAWLKELDRASLTEQRRLTIPFIRDLMARSAARAE
jgi:DnaA family protein